MRRNLVNVEEPPCRKGACAAEDSPFIGISMFITPKVSQVSRRGVFSLLTALLTSGSFRRETTPNVKGEHINNDKGFINTAIYSRTTFPKFEIHNPYGVPEVRSRACPVVPLQRIRLPPTTNSVRSTYGTHMYVGRLGRAVFAFRAPSHYSCHRIAGALGRSRTQALSIDLQGKDLDRHVGMRSGSGRSRTYTSSTQNAKGEPVRVECDAAGNKPRTGWR